MNLIDKRENGKLTTWVYTDETLRDAASAAARIARIAAGEHKKLVKGRINMLNEKRQTAS